MRNINFGIGEFYHIYNRGTEKRKIFLDRTDYFRFIILLYLSNGDRAVNMRETRTLEPNYQGLSKIKQGETLVDIGAYCLMPNHFHLLLRERTEGGISKFMQKVMTAYTMYFNGRHDRSGTLWQGVFKIQHADSDEYLKYLFSYIHLNPIKLIQKDWKERGIESLEKAEKYINNYEFSSCQDYLKGGRCQDCILNKKEFPEYFVDLIDFRDDLINWLKFDPEKIDFTTTKVSPSKVKPL